MNALTSRLAGLARLGLLTLSLSLGLGACDRISPPDLAPFQAIDITGATYAQGLSLSDPDGKSRSLAEFKGKAVIVFFGFTQCPDVCPTMLADIAQARERMGPLGAQVQPVFVTVDPERDSPEILKAYVTQFGPDVLALRGTLDQTRAVAQDFKVYFAKVPGKTEGSYTIDHTAGAYVFDPQGRVRLFMRHGAAPGALESDLRRLLKGA